jgi:hypothetical protein
LSIRPPWIEAFSLQSIFEQKEMNVARVQVAFRHAAQFAFDGFEKTRQGRTHALGETGGVQAAATGQPGHEIFSIPSKIRATISNTISVTAGHIYRTLFLRSTCWLFSFIRFLSYATEAISIAVQSSVPVQEYWNNLRAAIRLMLISDFDHLLRNTADPPEIRAP